jgi:hypothetical protein
MNWEGCGMRRSHPNLRYLPGFYLVYASAQLFEALRYKPKARGFDSRWVQPQTGMSTTNISWGLKAAGA